MTSFPPPNRSVLVRPAVHEDFPRIAQLLIQLYAAELPGALSGAPAGQQELLEFTLAAKQAQGLQGRYVACNAAGDILATGTVEYPGVTPYERAPDGTIQLAVTRIGYRATARLLLTVARSMVPSPRPSTPDAVWLHSVVVDDRHRGQGIGRVLMNQLEAQAIAHGYQAVWLQVLAMNQPARQLYQQLGYKEMWSSPRWHRLLTWPSYLMRKTLPASPKTSSLAI